MIAVSSNNIKFNLDPASNKLRILTPVVSPRLIQAKPSLVRLAKNGHAARKPPLVSLGSPQLGGAKKSSPLSSIATSPRLGMGLTTFRV